MSETLIKNATLINEGSQFMGSVIIKDARIHKIIPQDNPVPPVSGSTIDARGKILIPGVIDDQVHFREPGLTQKGDIYSESKAAIAGGVTSYMDMPNTNPQTITQNLLEDKYRTAESRSLANFSFYIGATNSNLEEILKTDPRSVCGIKIFLGSSTGNMLVNDQKTLENIFSQSPLLIAIHSEDEPTIQNNLSKAKARFGEDVPVYFHPIIRDDEACYRSSARAVEMATKYGTQLHILHLSTARELSLFDAETPLHEKKITCEVCVHHLIFSDKDYHTKGTLIKWNPAIKSAEDREALFNGLLAGKIDIIATDHAPHTFEEKQNTYFKAPSGGPLIQHSLHAMLEFCHLGKLPVEKVIEKMCHAPAELFRIKERGYLREGFFADLVLVDLNDPWIVSKDNLLYKCKWSPFEGMLFHSRVTHTFVNGNLVFENGHFNEESHGQRLMFDR